VILILIHSDKAQSRFCLDQPYSAWTAIILGQEKKSLFDIQKIILYKKHTG